MDYIQGPMGIFDFDKEGMLIEDFDKLGSMITIYNYPYYPKHMDMLGYEKEVDWVQVCIEVPKEIPSKYARVTQLSKEMFGLRVKKLTNADVVKHGYGRKVFKLLNTAYAPLFGYTELSDKQVDMYVKRYFPLIDKQMLPVIQNENEEVIGVAITMGSLSHALQKPKENYSLRVVSSGSCPEMEKRGKSRTAPDSGASRLSGTGGKRIILR